MPNNDKTLLFVLLIFNVNEISIDIIMAIIRRAITKTIIYLTIIFFNAL